MTVKIDPGLSGEAQPDSRFGYHPGIAQALRTAGWASLIALVATAGWFGFLQLTGNVHAVVAGQFYRSAQPTADDIAKYKHQYGIKTIVNLCGKNTGRAWYDSEVATAARLGITLIDFGMSAGQMLAQQDAAKLVSIFETARAPIFVHCQAGADRSGLAAALYVAAVSKQGEAAAEAQLSMCYGHVGLPYLSRSHAMDETWEVLEPWLGFPDS